MRNKPLTVLCLASLAGLIAVCSPAAAQVVALGASNTYGKGVGPGVAWPAQLEAMLRARGYNVRVVNEGINGDTTAGMLGRANSVPTGTKVVILAAGEGVFNDAQRGIGSRQASAANVNRIVAVLRGRGIKVIPDAGSFMTGTGVGIPLQDKQADGLHLTAQGHAIIASRLLPRVIAVLGKPRQP